MDNNLDFKFDELGYWSELKIEIVNSYAKEYSKILTAQKTKHGKEIFIPIYIDAFSGPGEQFSKTSGEILKSIPLNILEIKPGFKEYHYIDLDKNKIDYLRSKIGPRPDVYYYNGDCNDVLLDKLFPTMEFESYRKGLCILDPYGLHLNWNILERAGKLGSIEIFLNFPVMDMNRNAIWRKNPKEVPENYMKRMDYFWGDRSWVDDCYEKNLNLFEDDTFIKVDNETVAERFRIRLEEKAGFKFVPRPIPMKNSSGGIIYYLFFAGPNETGNKIAKYIFKTYRNKGIQNCH
ncbi:three-Cys-motif partner protein TcmP [candidate division KSB1 bacterium]